MNVIQDQIFPPAVGSTLTPRPFKPPLHGKIYRKLSRLYPIRRVLSPYRVLPNFIILGTQRGGTSALHLYLCQHPYVTAPHVKEIDYFSWHYAQGLSWYRSFFPTAFTQALRRAQVGRDVITGEASPSYLFYTASAARARALLPHAKLIVLLRNPVDRAYSHYQMNVTKGRLNIPFEQVVDDEIALGTDDLPQLVAGEERQRPACYLRRGIYYPQIKVWMDHFPREQFLILKSEDFYQDTLAALKRVADFLEIPLWTPLGESGEPLGRFNANQYASPLSAALREKLRPYFAPHNRQLYDFLGVDFGWEH